MRLPRRRQRQGTTHHGSPTFGVSVGLRAAVPALVALLTAMAAVPVNAVAQDPVATNPSLESEGSADDTVVVRFELAEGALDGVTSSVELVAALREHLAIDLAMPLDEPLRINLDGLAGRREGGQGPVYYFLLSPLGVGFQGEGRLEGFSYALAVRESHGADFPPDGDEWAEFGTDDWDEEEAWSDLVTALDVGLPQSTAEFGRPGEGEHLGLGVTEMHLHEFTMTGPSDSAWSAFGGCCPDLKDRAVLLIRPDVRLQSMMTAGDDAARDISFRLNVLTIELAPAAATTASEDAPVYTAADTEDAPVYTAADTEALEGTAMLQWACHAPELAGSDLPSTAKVTLDDEPRTGEAIVAVDGNLDGVIKLAGGDGDDGFCLILMVRDGLSEPGTYPIVKLAMDLMESETDPADPWMVASLASGADRETLFVAEAGFVEIISMEPSVRGRFELIGWTGDGVSRSEEQTITGSFDAAAAAK